MERLIKISEQTVWQLLGKVITSITTFIFLGLVARVYGEAGVGTFTLILTYLAMFYLLGDFGFNAHLLKKFQVAEKSAQVSLLSRLMGTRLLWSIILVILSIITLPFWPFSTPTFVQGVVIGGLAIIASAIFITNNLFFQTHLRYDLAVIASSVGTLFSLLVLVLFTTNQFPLSFLVLAHVLGWLVIAMISVIIVYRFIQNITPIFDYQFSTSLLKDSWPIALTLALNVVYFRADTFILASLKTTADVGIYNLAYSVFQSALVLPTFIMNAYYPLMLQSLTSNRQKFLQQLKIAGLILFAIAVAGSIVTYLFAPTVIALLGGGGFAPSITVLRILAIGFPGYFLSALLMWLFVAKQQYQTLVVIYGLGLLFNLTANLVLIPTHSYIAASWITIVSEYLILALLLARLKI